jgi:hypothetical protein
MLTYEERRQITAAHREELIIERFREQKIEAALTLAQLNSYVSREFGNTEGN